MIGNSLRTVRTRRSRTLGAFVAAAIGLAALASPSVVAAALPTSTTISASQTTAVAGDALILTAAVSPGPGGGAVSFTSSQFGSLRSSGNPGSRAGLFAVQPCGRGLPSMSSSMIG